MDNAGTVLKLQQRSNDGRQTGMRNVLLTEILNLVKIDYQINGKHTIGHLVNSIRRLSDYFGGSRQADTLAGGEVTEYILFRQSEGAANSSINRELSALRRAFSLAEENGLTAHKLKVKCLDENNVRQGFVEHEEFEQVRDLLPPHYRGPYIFAYYKGWRVSEIINIRLSWVDVEAGLIRLDPKYSKNHRGRVVALEEEVLTAIKGAISTAEKYGSEYLFTQPDGRRLTRSVLYRATKKYFVQAGRPDRIFHDLRRTAARNLVRAGNHEKVAMMTTGHRTRAVFDRYDIVNEADMIAAAQRVQEYLLKRGETDTRDKKSREGGLTRNFNSDKSGITMKREPKDHRAECVIDDHVTLPAKSSVISTIGQSIKSFFTKGESNENS